jgi:biopolymer transport protein ExbD
MKPLILLLSIIFFGTMAAHSQTTKDKLEKVKADPKTKERAAKADVYIAKQSTVIADSTSVKAVSTNSPSTNKNKKGKKKG